MKDTNYSVFAERIKSLRKDMRMNQNDFAKYLGISRVSITYYERAGEEDGRLPDCANLLKICNLCNCSSDWLLGLTDTRNGVATSYSKVDLHAALRNVGFSMESASQIVKWSVNSHIALQTLDTLLTAGITDFLKVVAEYMVTKRHNDDSCAVLDEGALQDVQLYLSNHGYCVIQGKEYEAFLLDSKIPKALRELLAKIK